MMPSAIPAVIGVLLDIAAGGDRFAAPDNWVRAPRAEGTQHLTTEDKP